ncbi:ATP-binding protein [Bacillus sp. SL00103]
MLQVLVENAVRHAFPKRQTSCEVIVSAVMEDGHVNMKVTDNGQGIENDKMAQLLKAPVESKEGTGTALLI